MMNMNVATLRKLGQVLCIIGSSWFVLSSVSALAADPNEVKAEDNAKVKTKIDWSKPVVSRGFGYEAQSPEDKPFVAKYKQGQIAYFFGEYGKAFTIWKPLAEKGHAQSQASLAWMYYGGLGTKKNLQKAFELYQKAANQKNAIAQNNLGTMYENGVFVKKDLAKATALYKLSAENGYRFGQYNYANALQSGWGGKVDKSAALIWYQKAANQNVKQALDKLSKMKE